MCPVAVKTEMRQTILDAIEMLLARYGYQKPRWKIWPVKRNREGDDLPLLSE